MASSPPRFTPGGGPVGTPPRPAATVLVLRDGATHSEAPLEVLLLRRSGKSGFMGGAFVFPGGKVDPADSAPELLATLDPSTYAPVIERWGPLADASAARALHVAALREVLEEVGLLLTTDETMTAPRTRDWRAVVAQPGLRLDLGRLHPWAHWITPSAEPKRFDTWFFVAEAPRAPEAGHLAGAHARADEHEATELRWIRPADALSAAAEGTIFLPPPTFVCLQELAEHATTAHVLAAARTRALPPIMPRLHMGAEHLSILLPWDAAYLDADGEGAPLQIHEVPAATARWSRLTLHGDRWQPARVA